MEPITITPAFRLANQRIEPSIQKEELLTEAPPEMTPMQKLTQERLAFISIMEELPRPRVLATDTEKGITLIVFGSGEPLRVIMISPRQERFRFVARTERKGLLG